MFLHFGRGGDIPGMGWDINPPKSKISYFNVKIILAVFPTFLT